MSDLLDRKKKAVPPASMESTVALLSAGQRALAVSAINS